ncbi:ATP-dependent RNA helicase, partial [Physocladia obscura]
MATIHPAKPKRTASTTSPKAINRNKLLAKRIETKKLLKIDLPKKAAKSADIQFSQNPKDWIPSDNDDDDDDDETGSSDETSENSDAEDISFNNSADTRYLPAKTSESQKTVKKKSNKHDSDSDSETFSRDSDTIPVNKLKWLEVSTFGNDAAFKDMEGFLCLEELDGVDVKVIEGKSGAKVISFKKSKNARTIENDSGKPATPDIPFSEKETLENFIHVDEFDEETFLNEAGKKAKKNVQSAEKPNTKTNFKNESISENNSVAIDTANEAKPLNKRERAALKRAAAAKVAESQEKDAIALKNIQERKTFESKLATHTAHVSPAVQGSWSRFRLAPAIMRALSDLKFNDPTDIQVKSLIAALNTTRKGNGTSSGRDIIGAAATGSGKTLSFGLPVVQYLAKRDEDEGVFIEGKSAGEKGTDVGDEEDEKDGKDVKEHKQWFSRPCTALIMTPTRELAIQVTEHLKAISVYTSAKVISIVGGMSLQKQRRQLTQSPDIIVATPGRLWELAEEDESFRSSLKCIKFFILDEADRMLEQGHFRDLENILNTISLTRKDDSTPTPIFEIPTSRQTFVFSATLMQDPSSLSKKLASKKPEKISKKGGPATTLQQFLSRLDLTPHKDGPIYIQALTKTLMASGLTEARIDVLDEDKDAAVYYLVTKYPNGRTIVFVNSIDMVRRLVPVFKLCGIDAVGLHSEMQQRQRLKYLDRFRDSSKCVLFATDVAARGLDIPAVEHVIHFHLPRATDWYVHRSGRTARAMSEGMSVAL